MYNKPNVCSATGALATGPDHQQLQQPTEDTNQPHVTTTVTIQDKIAGHLFADTSTQHIFSPTEYPGIPDRLIKAQEAHGGFIDVRLIVPREGPHPTIGTQHLVTKQRELHLYSPPPPLT
jgi:hypothetical protein